MDNFERKAPRSAIALYIKMYSKQRNYNSKGKKNLFKEASKSWLSLSEMEKTEFSKKYKECKLLIRKKVANQLKNIKPYMRKKREINSNNTSNSTEDLSISTANLNSHHNVLQIAEQSFKDEISTEFTQSENTLLPSDVVILEPNPPTLLSGEELFNMVHKEDTKSWREVLPAHKRQYQAAVLTIKKNYLKEYKTYLESLSILKLMEHYKNVKNELV